MNTWIVTPWHNVAQVRSFEDAWGEPYPQHVFIEDANKRGCAKTKNMGIALAQHYGAEVIVILDDDCYPAPEVGPVTLDALVEQHLQALEPQQVPLFCAVTEPQSRGTPYFCREVVLPVAASMGFWVEVGDYDAPSQLVRGATNPMSWKRQLIYGQYFPLSGMNLAFRTEQWPLCQFIDVPRFDDIWMGFIWQKIAYSKGQCFNLAGPIVRHVRQSSVWKNLKVEAQFLQLNETLWRTIHQDPSLDRDVLAKLIYEAL